MPDIKLPDGKKIPFSKKVDGFEIAKKISKTLKNEIIPSNSINSLMPFPLPDHIFNSLNNIILINVLTIKISS